jgi:flavin-binding protein dodecin
MSDHVYKNLELWGTSTEGIQEAIQYAVGRANGTIRNIRWVEMGQVRGEVHDGKVTRWQVSMKLGFTLED